MAILLVLLYWFLGFVGAIFAACLVGLIIAFFIALVKLGVHRDNWKRALVYLSIGALCYIFCYVIIVLCGYIGDRTNNVGQDALLVGLAFPGVFALRIIPQYTVMAMRQTSGIDVK